MELLKDHVFEESVMPQCHEDAEPNSQNTVLLILEEIHVIHLTYVTLYIHVYTRA